MTGHLLGAAGALEAIACIMAVNEDIVPPTINHEEGDNDPEIDYNLNFTFNKAQKERLTQHCQYLRVRWPQCQHDCKKICEVKCLHNYTKKIRLLKHKNKEPYSSLYKILGFLPR